MIDANVSSVVKEYRYERKFLIEQLDGPGVVAQVKSHPGMFFEVYPPRFVNNLYFDSIDMRNYFDNNDGISERGKVRIRWYHELFRTVSECVLEFKNKSGLVGTKIQYPFPKFILNHNYSEPYLRKITAGSDLPDYIRLQLLSLEPVLINRYKRRYFATPDHKFRITIDTGLTFYHLNKLENYFLFKQTDHKNTVLELKYKVEDDVRAVDITSRFPFRMTRSSKYIQGIHRVYH